MVKKTGESVQAQLQRDIGNNSSGSLECTFGGAPVAIQASNGAVVHATFITKKERKTSAPTMGALKELIDAVIATTKNESMAERLEICRSYLFNPLLRGKLDRIMFASAKVTRGVPAITAGG